MPIKQENWSILAAVQQCQHNNSNNSYCTYTVCLVSVILGRLLLIMEIRSVVWHKLHAAVFSTNMVLLVWFQQCRHVLKIKG